MASKLAPVASVLFILFLVLSSDIGVKCQSESDCRFIEESCNNHGDCQKICSGKGYSFGAVCAPRGEGTGTHCCCIVQT
ncbi:putative defensin-like protein [Corchorus capsularis]|uniref:Putative defensin-like protein n=1 Tax=Corchorus capsularis TaxID=210143 RepID=A0A1R3G7J2_COCAP|nr:putative defensin-like protein [Corchorus capsularis]